MSKSVLVIDTPVCCLDCPLLEDSGVVDYCRYTLEPSPQDNDFDSKRSENCPLKPLPSEYFTNENTDRWFYGYNRAIRDITGETECPRKN